MHTHNSALFFITTFVGILLLSTLWKAVAATIAERNPPLAGAMISQMG